MKKVLIIGGSSGIGYATALSLVDQGYSVAATYNQNEPPAPRANLKYYHLDVRDEWWNNDILPDQLDGLVYCPGSINLKPFHRIKPAQFTDDFNLQVVGAVKAIQWALPYLKAADSASVILFSTVAVQTGFPFHSQVSASKGAIEGLTKALAAEFAPHIRINCIAPSLTDTPLASKLLNSEEKIKNNADRHPLKRIGKSDDIAAMASFLLSKKASWITGQIFHVDGGMSTIKL
jgi:NAD(P)-dependent dehydrogenase (short-subunit alcohol dehydrogenase family)